MAYGRGLGTNNRDLQLNSMCCVSEMVFAITTLKHERDGYVSEREWLNQESERLKREAEMLTQERSRLEQWWA